MSQQILFRNFELLEPSFGELRGGYQLLVEGDTVKQLSETPIKASEADVIDCGRRTLMPGLIDCHVHAIHSEVNVRFMEALPLTLVTARAATRLRAMLDRGFTTVRDAGGADHGTKTAIETGMIPGPRLFISCRSIGPTGGQFGASFGMSAVLTPPSVCYADCDGSTTQPILNVADFTCFLQRYAANDPYANCDASTVPPTLNVADFACFLQKYAAGCSAP